MRENNKKGGSDENEKECEYRTEEDWEVNEMKKKKQQQQKNKKIGKGM